MKTLDGFLESKFIGIIANGTKEPYAVDAGKTYTALLLLAWAFGKHASLFGL